ncbi:hypothetical protein MFUL124B02_01265 [Myxococcus fulvus 124B02]|nr:hypothetical protein MFUL124B02_01265 [Myxococcus fulvus 124B02]
MKLKDPENIVRVEGHKGPHPEAYHERVLERLTRALGRCRQVDECRQALTRSLRQLGDEVATQGTELNILVTRGR